MNDCIFVYLSVHILPHLYNISLWHYYFTKIHIIFKNPYYNVLQSPIKDNNSKCTVGSNIKLLFLKGKKREKRAGPNTKEKENKS